MLIMHSHFSIDGRKYFEFWAMGKGRKGKGKNWAGWQWGTRSLQGKWGRLFCFLLSLIAFLSYLEGGPPGGLGMMTPLQPYEEPVKTCFSGFPGSSALSRAA